MRRNRPLIARASASAARPSSPETRGLARVRRLLRRTKLEDVLATEIACGEDGVGVGADSALAAG
jgi:hypothetical protein